MHLSIVIPTHRRPDLIGFCLDHLAPGVQTLAPEHYEVIVTDDWPGNETKDLIQTRYPWVEWVRCMERGPAANRNNGAKRAKGDWLVFIDDDCRAAPELLQTVFAIAAGDRADVVEGRIVCPESRDHPLYLSPDNAGGGFFWTANLSIRRRCFEELGGFDLDLAFNAEDMELGHRIRKRNLRVTYSDDARVEHPCQRITVGEYWKRFWAYPTLYLYALKKGAAPGLEAGAGRVAWYVISSHVLRQARAAVQILRGRHKHWRRPAAILLTHGLVMPVMIPRLLVWEFRFRRKLSARRNGPANGPGPTVDRTGL